MVGVGVGAGGGGGGDFIGRGGRWREKDELRERRKYFGLFKNIGQKIIEKF